MWLFLKNNTYNIIIIIISSSSSSSSSITNNNKYIAVCLFLFKLYNYIV